MTTRQARLRAVVWPAFLGAAVLEALVFAFVDPRELRGPVGALGALPAAVLTLAFLAFWLIVALVAALTQLLSRRPDEINARNDNDNGDGDDDAPPPRVPDRRPPGRVARRHRRHGFVAKSRRAFSRPIH